MVGIDKIGKHEAYGLVCEMLHSMQYLRYYKDSNKIILYDNKFGIILMLPSSSPSTIIGIYILDRGGKSQFLKLHGIGLNYDKIKYFEYRLRYGMSDNLFYELCLDRTKDHKEVVHRYLRVLRHSIVWYNKQHIYQWEKGDIVR